MNERLLVLAANEIAGTSENTIEGARERVNEWRNALFGLLRQGGTFRQIDRWKVEHADCDTWLAAADRLQEIGAQVSGTEMLESLLVRARAEHDRVKALVGTWREGAKHVSVFARLGENASAIEKADEESRVLSWCADRLEEALTEPTDAPISDPAERAKAVAKELRRRGYHADAERGGRVTWLSVAGWLEPVWRTVDDVDLATETLAGLGHLAIADRIQAKEAKRAKAWAGDE